jgi:response regulator of citrate/malate metabolism
MSDQSLAHVVAKTLAVLLVEDDPIWQEGIEALLSDHPYLKLAATADNYDEAMAAFERVHPQIVLLDWKIKGQRDGIMVGQALLKKGMSPEQMVVISGSPPSSVPQHPFLSIGKTRIASDLLPLLESVTKN